MDAARLKASLALSIDPILAHLKRQVADQAKALEVGKLCEVLTPAHTAELTLRLARREGEIEGTEAVWHWIQPILDQCDAEEG
jgi:hypothetical protein